MKKKTRRLNKTQRAVKLKLPGYHYAESPFAKVLRTADKRDAESVAVDPPTDAERKSEFLRCIRSHCAECNYPKLFELTTPFYQCAVERRCFAEVHIFLEVCDGTRC